jgi:hypothetical protein
MLKKTIDFLFCAIFGVFLCYIFLMCLISPEKDENGDYIPGEVVFFGDK